MMTTSEKTRMRLGLVSLGMLLLIAFGGVTFGQDLQYIGRIESRIGLLSSSDTLNENNLVHMERINWGIQQHFDVLGFQYSLAGGGVFRGSSRTSSSGLIPEYQAKARINPFGQLSLEMFSFSQLRNPMQIAQDTLQHHEQLSGVQLSSSLPNQGRFQLAYGLRKSSRDTTDISSQFMRIQLEQKLLGLHFRIRSEKDLPSGNNLASGEDDRSNVSIQWYGTPFKVFTWSAMHSVYNYNGVDYWRIYERVNYQFGARSTVWAHVRNEQIAYRQTYLNTQAFDTDYRFKLNNAVALQALVEGKKVSPLSGDPLYHWRAYLAGIHWRVGNRTTALGVVQGGYKESYRFGPGYNFRFEMEERLPLINTRSFRLGLSDHAEGEYFVRNDEIEEDPRYDIDHHFDVTLDLLSASRFQIANTFSVINHLGTDLDFSEDTLRNAMTYNIQFKFIERKLRASIDHMTINDLAADGDTRLHLNTRFTYRMTNRSSLNMISMYRYQSEIYPDYIWLNSFLKINMQYFNWALEVQAQGLPDTIFEDNFSVWMRFMRQL